MFTYVWRWLEKYTSYKATVSAVWLCQREQRISLLVLFEQQLTSAITNQVSTYHLTDRGIQRYRQSRDANLNLYWNGTEWMFNCLPEPDESVTATSCSLLTVIKATASGRFHKNRGEVLWCNSEPFTLPTVTDQHPHIAPLHRSSCFATHPAGKERQSNIGHLLSMWITATATVFRSPRTPEKIKGYGPKYSPRETRTAADSPCLD